MQQPAGSGELMMQNVAQSSHLTEEKKNIDLKTQGPPCKGKMENIFFLCPVLLPQIFNIRKSLLFIHLVSSWLFLKSCQLSPLPMATSIPAWGAKGREEIFLLSELDSCPC